MAVSNKFIELQQIKFDLFKEQNPDTGQFDVAFNVEGKILYAHKPMLNLVSPTFTSMLSDRWAKKDVPIKIESCSYDNFYQLLTFLYSAQCELTKTNIYAMVDLAEFYGINLFKDYCGEYLAAMKLTTENIFKLMDMADKYSMIQLKTSVCDYITKNFQAFANSDEFLKVSKQVIDELVVNRGVKAEDLFMAVYTWCENQALLKQTADPNVNLNNTIKNEFSSFLPHIQFDKMEMCFLLESVVPLVFIFPSPNELSKILCDRYRGPKVKITNLHGQTLSGNVIPVTNVIENIKSLNLFNEFSESGNSIWWEIKFKIPSTPSPLKKREGVQWYLFFFPPGQIGVKHCSTISANHYLLAELSAGSSGFELTANCNIEIE